MDNLISLFVGYRSISSLEGLQFFTKIEYLHCSNNNLTSLSNLPPNLKRIDCNDNKIDSLPKLPLSLKILNCYNTNIRKIKVHDSLEELNCGGNPQLVLDTLPSHLTKLSCYLIFCFSLFI